MPARVGSLVLAALAGVGVTLLVWLPFVSRPDLFLASLLCVAASASALAAYARKVLPEVAVGVSVAVFCLLPARHVLYRALGSAETAMALFVLLAALAWHEERIPAAFAFASLATLTWVNGVLVVGVLSLLLLARRRPVAAALGGLLAIAPARGRRSSWSRSPRWANSSGPGNGSQRSSYSRRSYSWRWRRPVSG